MSNKKQVMPLRQVIAQDKKLAKQLASQNSLGQLEPVSVDESSPAALMIRFIGCKGQQEPVSVDEYSLLTNRLYLNYERAKKLSGMFHSEGQTFNQITNSIQKVLNEHPVNVLVLASLIVLERERQKGKLEIETEKKLSDYRSQKAKNAADKRHSKPGGSRGKHEQIRAKWASGKYISRDICAEQEYSGLGFGSYKTARNALVKTPDPAPWPAKKNKI